VKKNSRFILALLSSLLLALPWYESFSGLIILVAFIPILAIEDYIYETRHKNNPVVIIGYSALTFGIWNILTTYWIYNAAFIGLVAAVVINTLIMSTTFWMFHFTKRKFGIKIGQLSLIIFWLAFEFFYLSAEISWPWLNLGNALAKDIKLIQWYEFTGTLGGTFWILTINLMLYNVLTQYIKYKKFIYIVPKSLSLLIMLLIPVFISLNIFNNYTALGKEYNIAIIQPNINPYTEKFGGLSHDEQLQIILTLADSISDYSTDYVIAPETALNNSLWLNTLKENSSVDSIIRFVNNNPNIHFIIGIDAFEKLDSNKVTPTARLSKGNNQQFYYNFYNSAIQIDTSDYIPVYHKSKLVTGVEKMPYPKIFKLLESAILDLGGTTGSRTIQDYRGIFNHTADKTKIAPVICYESVYGDYVTDYIKNGAHLIFIITNDGWWGNTIGHKHHLNYARLRAIENRRSIARSANTGISAFINQKGEILSQTSWWKRDAIKNTLRTNDKITFYARYGDYLGRLAGFLAVFLFLYAIVQHLLNKSILKR